MIEIKIHLLPHYEGLPLPAYQSAEASGMDLMAALEEDMTIAPGVWQAVPCGFSMELPQGYEAQVRPRSGLALKHGVTLLNSPGTIDADYRGELKAILINHSQTPFTVTRGMRIAQMVIAPVEQAQLLCTDQLTASGRGAGGFGSSGI